jgi:hypothetical protein
MKKKSKKKRVSKKKAPAKKAPVKKPVKSKPTKKKVAKKPVVKKQKPKKRSVLTPKSLEIRDSTKSHPRESRKSPWKSFFSVFKRKTEKKKAEKKEKPKAKKRRLRLGRPTFDIRFFKKVVFLGAVAAVLVWLFWGIPLPNKLSIDQVPISTKRQGFL